MISAVLRRHVREDHPLIKQKRSTRRCNQSGSALRLRGMPDRQRLGALGAVLGLVIGVISCGSPRVANAPPRPVPVAQDVPANVAALAAADDALGVDLLASPAVPRTGNVAVSPVSVALALQMVASGAAGSTAKEIAHVLHLQDGSAAATAAEGLLRNLAATERDDHNTLRVSNTVWTQQGLPIKPTFTEALRTRFASSVKGADFAHDPNGVRDRINATVADQTDGEIAQLFPPGTLDGTTRLVLTNAIYLSASWAQAFPPAKTAQAPFTRADGSTVSVPMMHNEPDQHPDIELGYASGPGYQVVTLPYVGGRLAFTVLLPTGPSLDSLIDLLRTKGLAPALSAVTPARVALAMPKFAVRSNLDLSGALASGGMPDAFADTADFSGITTAERLKIQTVRHETFVQADEHGTTAAAASGAGAQVTSAPMGVTVTIDHPFLFVITDTSTGAPLFLGKVTDPSAQS